MPQFFFDLSTPETFERDAVGLVFDSLEKAYLDARQAALDIGVEMLREGKDPSHHRFELRGADGQVVLELPFSEVLQPGRCPRAYETAEVHARLQASLERNRQVKREFADVLSQARKSAMQGLALKNVDWKAPGAVE